jgi:hypothetical protein
LLPGPFFSFQTSLYFPFDEVRMKRYYSKSKKVDQTSGPIPEDVNRAI